MPDEITEYEKKQAEIAQQHRALAAQARANRDEHNAASLAEIARLRIRRDALNQEARRINAEANRCEQAARDLEAKLHR